MLGGPDRGAALGRGGALEPPERGGLGGSERVCSNTLVAIAIMPAMSLTLAGTTRVLVVRARLPNCWI